MTSMERRNQAMPVARPIPPLPTSYRRTDDLEQHPALSRGDVRRDRRREAAHVLVIRDMQRDAVEGAAAEARDAFVDIARTEAQRRALTEVKMQLQRARKESQILAGDDPELAAKFAMLDDDWFTALRMSRLG